MFEHSLLETGRRSRTRVLLVPIAVAVHGLVLAAVTQGTVVVETIIDTEGRVTDVRVLKSLPMGLSQAAVDAVRQWRFKPATLNQRPVSVYFTLTVRFELQ